MEATLAGVVVDDYQAVSIHASVMEATRLSRAGEYVREVSIHASVMEATSSRHATSSDSVFRSTPP